MEKEIFEKARTVVCDGNKAAAHAVRLCRPDIISFYPITPQTPLLENLYGWSGDGLMDADFVEVEGETSAIGVVSGASAAGGRTFTASSGAGLAYMFSGYLWPSAFRLPVVMANVNREQSPPVQVAGGNSDMMSVKDGGWIQIHVENCQEILDTLIMAYRLAEDPEILLPVQVSYDGFVLSHLSQNVSIPAQKDVDRFLPPISNIKRPLLDPDLGTTFATWVRGELLSEFYYKRCEAIESSKKKIEEIEQQFHNLFGRSYGGLVEEYLTEDAEILMVSLGSQVGTMRVAVDRAREKGTKVGLVKIRVFRPFPIEKLAAIFQGKKAIGVYEKAPCWGWNRGHVCMEVNGVLGESGNAIPVVNFLGGMGSIDITIEEVEKSIAVTRKVGDGCPHKKIYWMPLEDTPDE